MVVAPWVKVKTPRGKKACIAACSIHKNIDIDYDALAAVYPETVFTKDNIVEIQNEFLEGLNQDQGTKTESKKIAATKKESKTGTKKATTKTGSAEKPGTKKRGRPSLASMGLKNQYQERLEARRNKNAVAFPPEIIEKYTPDAIENNHELLKECYTETIQQKTSDFLANNPDILKQPQKTWVNKYYVTIKTNIPKINYKDIDIINHVYDLFTAACYELGITPTIYGFCIFSGVECSWIKTMIENKQGLSPEYANFMKKACANTEFNLVNKLTQHDGANTNVMFLLNTCFGYDKKTVVSHVSSAETIKKLDDIPVFEIESND